MLKEKEKDDFILFDISNNHILGVFDNIVHVQSFDNILLIPREEYNRIMNLWLDGKQEYCKLWKHYCGVMGYTEPEIYEEIDSIFLSKYNQDSNKKEDIRYRTYFVTKFNDHLDFEHG